MFYGQNFFIFFILKLLNQTKWMYNSQPVITLPNLPKPGFVFCIINYISFACWLRETLQPGPGASLGPREHSSHEPCQLHYLLMCSDWLTFQ